MTETRPPADAALSGAELRRWYWLKSELATLARTLGVAATGSKAELTERLAATLDGGPLPATSGPRCPAAAPLPEPLGPSTVLPRGQRCTEQLRGYLAAELGTGFRFDAAMREFVGNDDPGRTLGDAVAHWYLTRGAAPGEIGEQFELNRFLRAWHAEHPAGGHGEALNAWRRHRSLPVDARP